MDEIRKEIAKRLKEFTNRKFVRQKTLSEKTGISTSLLSQMLKGERPINAKHLHAIRKVGCNINWLLTGEQSRSNNMVSENGEQNTIPGIAGELKELRKDNDELRKEVKEVKQHLDQAISYNSVIQYRLSDLQKENQKLKEDKEKLSVEVSSLNKALQQGVNKKK